ncbi:MAG: cob(I)yrinic acid a,c-diamide adenosyltransferase [Nitrospiraceae bacterium]|nr:cob(I)yrinic acid a,c-diamide adenosyltransferase [Nitrospiraceae bacterium]
MQKGLVHIYTGEGKGKTTAAVGLAVRAKSKGMKVFFAQFMKSAPPAANELDVLEGLSVRIFQYSEVLSPFFHPDADKKQLMRKASEALKEIEALMPGYDIVILDEFNNLVSRGIVSEEEALRFVKEKPENVELVLTGRNATRGLIEAADYVTEMKAVKHPLQLGIKARPGIEY